ncbi:hypothetical protein [Nocardia arizonensis]|uniref:hypothetical protein n=1 Tax=Nocardia arizonensis TaxID=1141647 RepID=UPI0006CF90C6|nr:hypothetical protein [Nocardia arizonensis]
MGDQKSAADEQKQRLDILLRDYDLMRGDERNQTAIYFTTFSIAIAMLVLLAGLLYKVLDGSGKHLPDFVLIGAPLIPLCLFVHLLTVAPAAVARAFYGRLLERRIQDLVDVRGAHTGLRFPSFMELNVTYSKFTRVTPYRTILGLLASIILVVFLGITAALISNTVHWVSRLVAIPFYAITTWLVVSTWVGLNRRGRAFFATALENYHEDRSDSLLPNSKGVNHSSRKFILYLLVPRPADLSKALFFPAGVGIGSLLAWHVFPLDLRFWVMWLTLEFLLYSARYQLNDIRGVSEDGKAPEKQARNRPQMTPAEMKISAAVLVLRIYAAFLVAIAPLGLGWNLVWALLGVAVSAIVYEVARSYERAWYARTSADRTEGRELVVPRSQRGVGAFVLVWVGIGYPVRTALGLFFVATDIRPAQVVTGILVFTFFFGLLFVTMTWALESVSYLVELPGTDDRPRLNWAIVEKPHLVRLFGSFRWNRLPPIGTDDPVAEEPPGSHLPAFRRLYADGSARRRTASLLAPWNMALAGCAVGVGIILAAPAARLDSVALWVTIGLLAGAVVVISVRRFDRICAVMAALLILSLAVAVGSSYAFDSRLGMATEADIGVCSVAATGWAFAIGFTVLFGFNTYHEVLQMVPKLLSGLRIVAKRTLSGIFGKHFVDSTRWFDKSVG